MSAFRQQRSIIGKCAAGVMLSLWLVVLGITASPDLHGRLHKDSQSPTHTCIVTQLQHQNLLSTSALIAAPLPNLVPSAHAPLVDVLLPAARDLRLADSRAPPAPCPSSTVVG